MRKFFFSQFTELEPRHCPAGTLVANFANGILRVDGDSAANALRINVNGANCTFVSVDNPYGPSGATRIVSNTGNTTFNNVNRIELYTNGGNDYVEIEGSPSSHIDSLRVETGTGDDHLFIQGLNVTGKITVRMGDGDDVAQINAASNSMDIGLGNGVDKAQLSLPNRTTYDSISITGGAGQDTIGVASAASVSTINSLAINTGNGNDRVNIGALYIGTLDITGTMDPDTIVIDPFTRANAGKIKIH